MAPPSASTSLTRWPLPMPPIEGLHDIWPSVSMLWVSSSVLRPILAQASAASVPAWPPPTTITSYRVPNIMILLRCLILMCAARIAARAESYVKVGLAKSSLLAGVRARVDGLAWTLSPQVNGPAVDRFHYARPLRRSKRGRHRSVSRGTLDCAGAASPSHAGRSTWNKRIGGECCAPELQCAADTSGPGADYNRAFSSLPCDGHLSALASRLPRDVRPGCDLSRAGDSGHADQSARHRDTPNAAAGWRPTRASP